MKDYNDIIGSRIRDIIESRGMSMARIASILDISPASLSYGFNDRNYLPLRTVYQLFELLNLKITITENTDIPNREIGTAISKNNVAMLVNRFFIVNEDILMDNEEQLEYELQEFILENNGLEVLLKHLNRTDRHRINAIPCYSGIKGIKERILALHQNGYMICNAKLLLRVAVIVNIRNHFGSDTNELKKSHFPGPYIWDLVNYETILSF